MPLPNVQLQTTCIYAQIVTQAQLISLQSLSEWMAKPCNWTLLADSTNMFATTTTSALHQPFPSCKEEKFFN